MNAVEIEEAVSELFGQPFDRAEFPFQFLLAFGNKETTVKKLRAGASNLSDVAGGVLQRNNIHIATCDEGAVEDTLKTLRDNPKTAAAKAKFILATDGVTLHAEDLSTDEIIITGYSDFPDRFGVFLSLAGISTVKEIKESGFDIKATGLLNRLYIELLKSNPDWAKAERRPDMNHFMARLIFCFFAEDTDIFHSNSLFTSTLEQMSASDSSNTHEVIAHIFLAMNTATKHQGQPDNRYRDAAKIRPWANTFPYVNGGLFGGNLEVPVFSRLARSYLLKIGGLNWKKINPDIFGSMIQAVADDDERGALGMHYTSVPNILKVLNPLFLDDLRAALKDAGDNARKLLNLRNRLSRIRVFDPACGSGNFLVIAYKQMREIEAEINRRRGEQERRTEIPLTNFRGIELRHFPAEIARLALIIAEYQSDVLYRGQKEALAEFLPLNAKNWIICGNALRLDWLSICPPTGTGIKYHDDDLFETPLQQPLMDFENEGGETYICGNPPYKGRNKKEDEERSDTEYVFSKYPGSFASLDYVANWFVKACHYCNATIASAAFVATNSICQGEQVALLWNIVFGEGLKISFAHTSFKWSNLASDKAGVTVVIVGISRTVHEPLIFTNSEVRRVETIGPYLVPNSNVIVKQRRTPISDIFEMYLGNMAKDGGNLIMSAQEGRNLIKCGADPKLVRQFFGSEELIHSKPRACLWLSDIDLDLVQDNTDISARIERVRKFRLESKAPSTRSHARTPHRFVQFSARNGEIATIIPRVSSENRDYLPAGYLHSGPIIGDKCYALYDAPLWNMALIVSRLHWVWIGTVCVRMRTDFSYSNTLGWNTFPVPKLTTDDKAELARCAEDILLAREAHYPATIADLYDPTTMPQNLRDAHDRNDETLERIYIGRRFRNDTERLEHLFERYTQMTTDKANKGKVS